MNSSDAPSQAQELDTPYGIGPSDLRFFVTESNRIESIRGLNNREIAAHLHLLSRPSLMVGDVATFVRSIAGVKLRNQDGMNVRVGDHIPPRGGPHVESELAQLLARANRGDDPWDVHVAYETLHPFMDGNGRSGRAIWLWQMLRQQNAPWVLRMGFLHLFYYQTLQHSGPRQHNARDGSSPNTTAGETP